MRPSRVTIQPGPIAFPGSASGATVQNVSRIKVDVDVPANATLVEATIVPGTSAGLSGVAPNILRVNENGNVDPNGTILRLSGNNQVIGNSPSSSINSEGGIVVKATGKNVDGSNNADGYTQFQLPQVKAVLKAGDSGDVAMKVRTGGSAGAWNNDRNFLTFLPKATLVITAWAPTRCTPRDAENGPLNSGAGPLATTRIIEADKATTTTVVGPANAKNGTPVTLSANVSGGANGGTVQFFDGDNPLEDAVPVTGVVGQHLPDLHRGRTALHHRELQRSPRVPGVDVGVGQDRDRHDRCTAGRRDHYRHGFAVDREGRTGRQPDCQGRSAGYRRHRRFHRRRHRNGQCSGRNRRSCRRSVHLHLDRNAQGCREVHGLTRIRAVRCPGIPGQCDDAGSGRRRDDHGSRRCRNCSEEHPGDAQGNGRSVRRHGKVQFKVGDTLIGGPVDVVNGVATVPATFYNSGTYSVTAEFVGASGYTASASAPQTLTVPGDTDGGPGGGTGSLDLGTLFGSLGG